MLTIAGISFPKTLDRGSGGGASTLYNNLGLDKECDTKRDTYRSGIKPSFSIGHANELTHAGGVLWVGLREVPLVPVSPPSLQEKEKSQGMGSEISRCYYLRCFRITPSFQLGNLAAAISQ